MTCNEYRGMRQWGRGPILQVPLLDPSATLLTGFSHSQTLQNGPYHQPLISARITQLKGVNCRAGEHFPSSLWLQVPRIPSLSPLFYLPRVNGRLWLWWHCMCCAQWDAPSVSWLGEACPVILRFNWRLGYLDCRLFAVTVSKQWNLKL
jgi:hypothetical protein